MMPVRQKILIFMGISAALLLVLASRSVAASFHWVDRDGFHSVDQVTKVPLEHRKDLPMARNRTSLPFTKEEDRDGAMYVWFILGQAGCDYPYVAAKDFPYCPFFKMVETPQEGDIAWWKGFVALYREKDGALLVSRGTKQLKAEEKKRGKATWFRYDGPPPAASAPVMDRAPQQALKTADTALSRLEGAAVFPSRIKGEAERELLEKNWKKAAVGLEALRKKYPDDPQVLWRLGECYRRGHNIAVPGAWDRTEAFFLRAEELGPEVPEPYLYLGAHYADTHFTYGERAEAQFRGALPYARKDQLPQVWWGLAVALYYQGKTKEAVKAADRLIALRPNDARAQKLRATLLEAGKGT